VNGKCKVKIEANNKANEDDERVHRCNLLTELHRAPCERSYIRAFLLAMLYYPPPLQGGVVRVRAFCQAQTLLPSVRREVEANISVSQTFRAYIRVRFVLIAFLILIVSNQIVVLIFSNLTGVKNVTIC
jgi:hypothetical protein